MKKSKHLLILVMSLVINYAAFAVTLPSTTNSHIITEINPEIQLSATNKLRITEMKMFASMTVEQYAILKGKKLNIFEKIAFNANQKRAKNLLKAYSKRDDPTVLSKISWLLKGLLFGPLALVFGYLFLKDDDRELIKWIWFGFAGFVAILAVVLLTL